MLVYAGCLMLHMAQMPVLPYALCTDLSSYTVLEIPRSPRVCSLSSLKAEAYAVCLLMSYTPPCMPAT